MRPANNLVGHDFHAATKHSWRSVQMDPNYVDATTQPSPFKFYPHFFRRIPLDLEHPVHTFLHRTSAITFHKQYREGRYALRVNPSAGALYPTEVYVQLRGIPDMIDGLYHLEVASQSLTLIYELIDDGLEAYLEDDRILKGYIFLVSCVYFRSSWKYKNRSLRYCFLDAGHHLGAIEAAAYLDNQPTEILFDLDHQNLNDDLGFEPQEFVTAALVVGERKDRAIRRLRSPLPFVAGTDYFEANRFITAGYQQTLTASTPQTGISQPQFQFVKANWQQAIQTRRSARRLQPSSIDQAVFWAIWQAIMQPIATTSVEPITLYAIVHQVAGLTPGIYQGQDCLKPGLFRAQTGYLCINQAIARDSAVTFFIVADYRNYRVALQMAGLLGQRIYLAATYYGLGCSGIGAFFDDEVQTFLEIDHPVLYAIAIGVVPTPNPTR